MLFQRRTRNRDLDDILRAKALSVTAVLHHDILAARPGHGVDVTYDRDARLVTATVVDPATAGPVARSYLQTVDLRQDWRVQIADVRTFPYSSSTRDVSVDPTLPLANTAVWELTHAHVRTHPGYAIFPSLSVIDVMQAVDGRPVLDVELSVLVEHDVTMHLDYSDTSRLQLVPDGVGGWTTIDGPGRGQWSVGLKGES